MNEGLRGNTSLIILDLVVFVSVLLHVSVIKANGAAAISDTFEVGLIKVVIGSSQALAAPKIWDELNREYALNLIPLCK